MNRMLTSLPDRDRTAGTGGRSSPSAISNPAAVTTSRAEANLSATGSADVLHDLIIDRGKIRKRTKAASRKFRGEYGHTPLSAAEDIPWRCRRLVIGTGADGALPVMQEVRDEARRRAIDLVVLPTAQAVAVLTKAAADTNAILHLTC